MKRMNTVFVGPLLAALVLPAVAGAQNWTGSMRCEISVDASGYTQRETQTWTLTGGAPTQQGAFEIYPATWTVTGQGNFDRTNASNARRVASWTSSVPATNAPIAFRTTPAGRRVVQLWHSMLSMHRAYSGTEQYFQQGVPQPPKVFEATVYEWQPAHIEVALADTRISGSQSKQGKHQVGPVQPSEAMANIACTWSFGRGSAPPLPPPTLPPATTSPGSSTPPATPPGTTTPPGSSTPPTTPPGSSTPPSSGAKLLSVAPATVEQGAIGTVVTITGQGTRWMQSRPTVSVEPGVGWPVTEWQATSDTELLAAFQVQYAAAPGPRTVTVTSGSETLTLPNSFTVTARTRPEIVSVTPNRAKQGERNLILRLVGRNTRWTQGNTRVQIGRTFDATQTGTPDVGPGITVVSTTVQAPDIATATIDVDPNATPGAYLFSVFDAAPSDWLKIVDGFTVEPGTGAPPPAKLELTEISPNTAAVGAQNIKVTLTGRNTRWVQGKTAVFIDGGGIAHGLVTVESPTRASMVFSIAADAPTGARDLRVVNSASAFATDEVIARGGFTITAAPLMTAVPLGPGVLPPIQLAQVKFTQAYPSYWAMGQEQQIAWTHTMGPQALFDVEASFDDGATWTMLARGAKPFPLPKWGADAVGTQVISPNRGGAIRLRVRASGQETPSDVSSYRIGLATPAMHMERPAAGDRWVIGAPAPSGAVNLSHNLSSQTSFSVELSRDGGASWTRIGQRDPGAPFAWASVTGPATTQARIRLRPMHGGAPPAGASPFSSVEAVSPDFTIASGP